MLGFGSIRRPKFGLVALTWLAIAGPVLAGLLLSVN